MHIHPDLFFFAILLILILWIVSKIIYSRVKKNPINSAWTRSIKYLGQISLGLGVLLQLIELSSALEYLTSSLTSAEIARGLRSTFFSTIHGLIVYLIAMVLFAILRLTERNNQASGL
jgi:energy-coupling factor transporter transmembrane protein EcfT